MTPSACRDCPQRPAPPASASMQPNRTPLLNDLLSRRILVLDGAMGTMIQGYRLSEAEYRGRRFADWQSDLRGQQRSAGADAAAS